MAGQIVKRGDKTWTVRILRGRDENGKRRYVNKTIHGTKKDAEKYRTGKLRDRDLEGVTSNPPRNPATSSGRSGCERKFSGE